MAERVGCSAVQGEFCANTNAHNHESQLRIQAIRQHAAQVVLHHGEEDRNRGHQGTDIDEDEDSVSNATTLDEVEGLTPKMIERLTGVGIESVSDLKNADVDQLTAIPGVGAATAEKMLATVQDQAEKV